MDRRALGLQVAEAKARRRALLGRPAIEHELEQLDEATLGRRRRADEGRRYRRLLADLDALPSEPQNGAT